MDLLRAISILVVIVGHWLMAVVTWNDGTIRVGNTLSYIRFGWLATWLLQVMPLFFFVGGFANKVSYDSLRAAGGTYGDHLSRRLGRILRPTAVFVGIWLVFAAILDLVLNDPFASAMGVLAKPLWFIGVYLVVIAFTPMMLAIHERFGHRAVLGLGGGVITIDLVGRASALPDIGWANFLLMWLFAHQLGFLYADGTLARWGRRGAALMAGGGLVSLIAFTTLGWYPGSMIGVPNDPRSNMDPPSTAVLALTVWMVGLAMLARPGANRWLQNRRPWRLVVAGNAVIMTAFLWHLTAVLFTVVVSYPLGFPQLAVGSKAWWLLRIPWVAMNGVGLVVLVFAFGRVERQRAVPTVGLSTPRAGLATLAAAYAITGFAVRGFDHFFTTETFYGLSFTPAVNLFLLVGATLLLRGQTAGSTQAEMGTSTPQV